jgi:peptidoglycan/xylan/chitin deacetylase (PgdA/CDA1 family)
MTALVVMGDVNGMGAETSKLPILCYHHVMPEADIEKYADNGLVMSKELFGQHMEYLYQNKYHTVSVQELRDFVYDKKPLPPKSVMISFDDGYMSNYMFAYPILKQFGFKAALFVITDGIGLEDAQYHKDELDMLSWLQIAASTDVFTVGSHTNALHFGKNGKTGLVLATPEEADADLKASLRRVQDKTIFAYPQGMFNKQIIQMLKNNNIEMAFSILPGYVTKDSDPYILNRFTIYSTCTIKTFEKIVSARY